MLKNILILLFIFINLISYSQIPVGKWRDHFSYKKTTCLADAGEKIYIASENAVFSYDINEGTVAKLNKTNGYSDSEIQTLAYNQANNVLIIVYKNSNIDILKNNTIYNLSEIKRKLISTNKTVYNITFIGNTAYLACGFGIVLLDTDNLEFEDTYFIGDNASYVKVNDIAYDGTNIYAATDNGLFFADFNNPNLFDYRNWNLVPDIPENDSIFNNTEYFNGYLFANKHNSATENDTLYYRKNNNWLIFNSKIKTIRSLTSGKNYLTITVKDSVSIYNKSLNLSETINLLKFPEKIYYPVLNYAITNDEGNIYMADNLHGFAYRINGETDHVFPDGPYNNYTAKVFVSENTVITTDGNDKAKGWYQPTYNIFQNEKWENYHIPSDTARNFFSIAVNPKNNSNLFFGSWGYGIYEFSNNEWTNSYNQSNSTLQAISPYGYGFIRINGLVFDKNNNLWVTNESVGEPISVKTEDNQWQSFNCNGTITNDPVKDIYVTDNNFKWIELGSGKGILVIDDNNTPLNKKDDQYKIIIPTTSEGENISSDVTAFSQDKEGNLWMGTGNGIVIYYNADNAFEDDFVADRIQLTSYGKDTTEQYLLSTDIINDIETDGADRKWIATQSSGAFLVSENGKKEILHFNKYNSPLISNTINDIAINHESGEVFFLTDKGIMSYRGEATEGGDTFGNVYVFPNPVRPGYNGKITVTGLAANVNVKFTDISGNLVFETSALGGQAIWDGKTFDGRKVHTGVYLIFCSNKDGSETFVTKLLFIN